MKIYVAVFNGLDVDVCFAHRLRSRLQIYCRFHRLETESFTLDLAFNKKKQVKHTKFFDASNLKFINLRFLQFPRIINVNRFPLAENIENLRAGFAVAVAGGFGSAKREMDFRPNGCRIDIANSGVKLLHRVKSLINVARVNR